MGCIRLVLYITLKLKDPRPAAQPREAGLGPLPPDFAR